MGIRWWVGLRSELFHPQLSISLMYWDAREIHRFFGVLKGQGCSWQQLTTVISHWMFCFVGFVRKFLIVRTWSDKPTKHRFCTMSSKDCRFSWFHALNTSRDTFEEGKMIAFIGFSHIILFERILIHFFITVDGLLEQVLLRVILSLQSC